MPNADTHALQHAIDRLLKQAYKGAKQAVEAGFRLRYSAWTEPGGNEPAEFPAAFSTEEEIAKWIADQGGLDRDEECNRIDPEIARLAQALRMFRDSFHETHLRTEHSATPIPERLRPAILFEANGPIYRANKLASKLRFIICREAAPGLKDNYAAFSVPTEAYPRIKEALATLEFPAPTDQWLAELATDLDRAQDRLRQRLLQEAALVLKPMPAQSAPASEAKQDEGEKPGASSILPALLSASDLATRVQRNRKSVTSFLSRFAENFPIAGWPRRTSGNRNRRTFTAPPTYGPPLRGGQRKTLALEARPKHGGKFPGPPPSKSRQISCFA